MFYVYVSYSFSLKMWFLNKMLLIIFVFYTYENFPKNGKNCEFRHFYILRNKVNLRTFFNLKNWLAGKNQCLQVIPTKLLIDLTFQYTISSYLQNTSKNKWLDNKSKNDYGSKENPGDDLSLYTQIKVYNKSKYKRWKSWICKGSKTLGCNYKWWPEVR